MAAVGCASGSNPNSSDSGVVDASGAPAVDAPEQGTIDAAEQNSIDAAGQGTTDAATLDAACVPDCTLYSCGEIETLCGTTCGDACDFGCTDHCANGVQDCDETGLNCGGADCAVCTCVPDCTLYSCGQTEPTCGTTCGSACDFGCTDHCTNGVQDCDETGMDCGGTDCTACPCVPDCTFYSCGQTEPTCGTTCGNACDLGCTAHCSSGVQDCDETGVDCGGATCGACPTNCGTQCYYYDGTCSASYIDACDGCDMGCEVHDPDCDDPSSTCLDACPCLGGLSSWYCDGFDDCTDPACECAGDNPCVANCTNGVQDCDETGVDCGGATCGPCGNGCGTLCYYYNGTCSASYIDACDGCDMGCEVHDPDCDDPASTCMDGCACLGGWSHWYCDGFDDCADASCECATE